MITIVGARRRRSRSPCQGQSDGTIGENVRVCQIVSHDYTVTSVHAGDVRLTTNTHRLAQLAAGGCYN